MPDVTASKMVVIRRGAIFGEIAVVTVILVFVVEVVVIVEFVHNA